MRTESAFHRPRGVRAFARRISIAFVGAVVACGGAKPPPAASAASSTGAAAVAPDLAPDVVFSADLVAMRNDKNLAKVMTKAEESASPEVAGLIKRIDRVDVRGTNMDGEPSWVAVLWGHLPKDPGELAVFAPGSEHAVKLAEPTLASGVKEYAESGPDGAHLFAVSDAVWVLAGGSALPSTRAHFATSAAPPAPPPPSPEGELLHFAGGASLMSKANREGSPLKGLDRAEMNLAGGMTSLKGVLTFKEEGAATDAETKIKLLSTMILAAASSKAKECRALEKLGLDVGRESRSVRIEVRGIGDAADAWDPATCPKFGEDQGEASSPMNDDPGLSTARGRPGTNTGARLVGPSVTVCSLVVHGKRPSVISPVRRPRPMSLLSQELNGLEQLLPSLPFESPDRGAVLGRLAADYDEWMASAKATCASHPDASATSDDAEIAGQILPKMRVVCLALKKDFARDAKHQCK